MKTGIVDVGGGLRGIYAAGIFDHCLEEGIQFDVGVGVSAGSANLASFIAGQKKRNYPFYTEYPFRREYMSFRNFARIHAYLDLDYIYGPLSNSGGENPLDFKSFMANPMEFIAVATNALNGEPEYFGKQDLKQDEYDIFKASCAIPFICRPCEIDGVPYYDGALGDTIPIEKAFERGCDKVVLILTRPRDTVRTPDTDEKLAQRIRHRYPLAAKRLCMRADQYNRGVALAKEYEAQGRLMILAPDDTCGVSTLTRDKAALRRLYKKGYHDAEAIRPFLNGGR